MGLLNRRVSITAFTMQLFRQLWNFQPPGNIFQISIRSQFRNHKNVSCLLFLKYLSVCLKTVSVFKLLLDSCILIGLYLLSQTNTAAIFIYIKVVSINLFANGLTSSLTPYFIIYPHLDYTKHSFLKKINTGT